MYSSSAAKIEKIISLARPHSKLDLVQVIVSQLTHRHSKVEFRNNFLLWIQKNCANSMQTTILEVPTV